MRVVKTKTGRKFPSKLAAIRAFRRKYPNDTLRDLKVKWGIKVFTSEFSASGTMEKAIITKVAKEMGLKRVDAKRSMLITVRKGDIAKATKKNHRSCAFAQACIRQFGAENVFFLRTTAYVQKGKRLERFKLPTSVQKEIVSFDRTANMAPGTYQLTKPSKSNQLGVRVKRKRDKNRNHGPGKTRFVHRMTGVRGQAVAE